MLSAAAILLTLPVLLALALAVRLGSPGPALFRQGRLGLGGRRFEVLKFRTMCRDAEAALSEHPGLREAYLEHGYKLPSAADPRVTRLGRLLRRTSLDELPQLFNVLRGEMSLVGPRPVVPEEIVEYGADADVVLSVKPGITGLWQVSGRNDVGYPRRARLDVAYVTNWSLLLDLRVLSRTPAAVLRGERRASTDRERPKLSLRTGAPTTAPRSP